MSASAKIGKLNWADVSDNEALTSSSPSHSATGSSLTSSAAVNSNLAPIISSKPDAQGVRTVVEYIVNDKGQKMKITRRIKSVVKQVRVNKNVSKRRQWAKFGDCAGVPPGPEVNVTTPSYERIHLDLRPKKREDEKEESSLDKLSGSSSIVVCRNCGETGHWTLKCPKRSQISAPGMDAPLASSADLGQGPDGDDESGAAAGAGGAAKGKYVPMHARGGSAAQGVSSLQTRDDTNTLRVTNLSEDVTEDDLRELFSRAGHVARIYLAKDRQSGLSRGFAFINFNTRREAEAAINLLSGHGYDNLILKVEWAKPREERPEA